MTLILSILIPCGLIAAFMFMNWYYADKERRQAERERQNRKRELDRLLKFDDTENFY